MANTGWLIYECITCVAENDISKPLDRNGLVCNITNADGVLVSSAGLKQACYLLQGTSPSKVPSGGTKMYSTQYDILGYYPVDTEGRDILSTVTYKGCVVAIYKGSVGQDCPKPSGITEFSVTPNSIISSAIPGTAVNEILVTSIEAGVGQSWYIYSKPTWVSPISGYSSGNDQSVLKFTVDENMGTSARSGLIILCWDSDSLVRVSISITQNGQSQTVSSHKYTFGIFSTSLTGLAVNNGAACCGGSPPSINMRINIYNSNTALVGQTNWVSCSLSPNDCTSNNRVIIPATQMTADWDSGSASLQALTFEIQVQVRCTGSWIDPDAVSGGTLYMQVDSKTAKQVSFVREGHVTVRYTVATTEYNSGSYLHEIRFQRSTLAANVLPQFKLEASN